MALTKNNLGMLPTVGISPAQDETLKYLQYDPIDRRLKSNRAIETTLNSLYLGEQHKMSSGAENIFFTNLGSDINFYPMWGGLKNQSVPENRDGTGFIPPSGRVYTDLISTQLGGEPLAGSAISYEGGNYFGVNIAGLGITTVVAEHVPASCRLEYRLSVDGKQVYMQELEHDEDLHPDHVLEWFFDHPVEIHAGTTIFAAIYKVDGETDLNLGPLQVRVGDDGQGRYQATVHNRLFEDKDLEYISPHLKYTTMDFSLDPTGSSILFKDLSLGAESFLAPYPINTVQAVANGDAIEVRIKDGKKVLIESLPLAGASINGNLVNATLSRAVTDLNDLFTNATGFSSGDTGNPVTNFVLNNNDLTISLQDGTSYTVDVTTLGVDENKFVQSGTINGGNLDLTMTDASIVSVDMSNMISGSTLPAVAGNWYVAYGADSGDEVTVPGVNSLVRNKQPFYFGNFLEKGREYVWTHDTNGTYVLGAYSGSQVNLDESDIMLDANWAYNFKFSRSDDTVRHTSVATDVASRFAAGYSISNNTVFALRYGQDNYMRLFDISNGDEVLIGQTNVPLSGDTQTIFMGGGNQPNAKFPNIIERNEAWTIVHDFNGSEAGVLDGIKDHTVIRSNISCAPGEKLMIDLNIFGRSNYFGTNYSGASTDNGNAEEQLANSWRYNTSEALQSSPGAAWVFNTAAAHYNAGNGWERADGNAGMVSLRYLSDNSLELWSEDDGELIATCVSVLDGSPFHLHYGVRENTSYGNIMTVSKQTLGQASQPVLDFAPDITDQVVEVTEGQPFNYQIGLDANSDIVNQYGELDAPNWAVLNQLTGVFNGTAPAYTGTSDDYVITCKAANVLGGVTNFNVTFRILEQTYTNTKSLKFADGVNSFLGGNAALVSALERSGNGSGSQEAWTIAFWYKRTNTGTAGQTLLYFGNNDTTNQGYIEIKQTNNGRVRLRYGSNNNYIQVSTPDNAIPVHTWAHIVVTYDGGTTGAGQSDLSNYYSRFKIYSNGVLQSQLKSHNNYGYTGSIVGQNFRFGKLVSGNYPKDGMLNQLAIWASDQSSNVSGLYNSGATQDIIALTAGAGNMNTNYLSPSHVYEIGDSVTTIEDLAGNAHLVGYNFTSSDLVSNAP